MRSIERQTIRDLLGSLPTRPSEVELQAAVDALVKSAIAAKKPLMSIGATLRHCGKDVQPPVRARLREAANAAILASARPDLGDAKNENSSEWLTVREAAIRAGCSVGVFRERLHYVEHRRRLGWPVWDGYQWLVATAVFDPLRRAAFLLAQPVDEPLSELLPPTCERAPRHSGAALSTAESTGDSGTTAADA